jgi:hypothetical protein
MVSFFHSDQFGTPLIVPHGQEKAAALFMIPAFPLQGAEISAHPPVPG